MATLFMKKGFTLMELLIVIAIIGILVTIALSSYSTAQKNSRDVRRVNDLKQVQNAWEQYYADNNSNYPGPSGSSPAPVPCMTPADALTMQTYMPNGYPVDPKNGTPYAEQPGWSSCRASDYCFCTGMELSKSTYESADCDGTETPELENKLYCVRSLQ